MAFLTKALCFFSLLLCSYALDPCKDYIQISHGEDGRRSTGNYLTTDANPMCDRYILYDNNYYRFVNPEHLCEEIPDGPVEHFYCGTVWPIYFMDPPDPGVYNQSLLACMDVNYECSHNHTMEVVSCPADADGFEYYVYQLHRPDFCDTAYCAGTLPRCDCKHYWPTLPPSDPPAVTGISNNGICDRRTEDCSKVQLSVTNLNNKKCLMCSFTPMTIFDDGSITINATNTRTVKAKYRAPNKVECLLNEDVQRSSRHASIPKLGGMVSVSQDGKNFSVRQPFASYDSTCQQCHGNSPLSLNCTRKPHTCYIEGKCYLDKEQNPDKSCLVCSHWENDWGPKPGSTPPDMNGIPSIILHRVGYPLRYYLPYDGNFIYELLDSNIPGVKIEHNRTLFIPGCDSESPNEGKARYVRIKAITDCRAARAKYIRIKYIKDQCQPCATPTPRACPACAASWIWAPVLVAGLVVGLVIGVVTVYCYMAKKENKVGSTVDLHVGTPTYDHPPPSPKLPDYQPPKTPPPAYKERPESQSLHSVSQPDSGTQSQNDTGVSHVNLVFENGGMANPTYETGPLISTPHEAANQS